METNTPFDEFRKRKSYVYNQQPPPASQCKCASHCTIHFTLSKAYFFYPFFPQLAFSASFYLLIFKDSVLHEKYKTTDHAFIVTSSPH